jgi:hypothetical protein
MKWKKLGKIFDPTEHLLSNDCKEFAQSPQTLVFDDFVRIYFSTRQKDPSNGKFISHIAFVDMDKTFTKVLNISKDPVIELGGLGTFDEHGIFPINIVKAEGKILAFTCGWSRRVSVSVETSTGVAVSNDNGITFDKLGTGPVLTSSVNEPFLVGDSFVQYYDNKYHMWYMYGTKWADHPNEQFPDRVYKIGYASSNDGINWIKEGKQIINDVLNEDECQALPSVVKIGNRYHMYFCFREATGFRTDKTRGYRLGYAYSDDMRNWVRNDAKKGIKFSSSDWDSDMMCYPHIFNCDEKTYLLYNGNQFGRFGFGIAELESV